MAEYVDIDYPFTAFTDRGQTIETSIRKIMQTNPFLDIPIADVVERKRGKWENTLQGWKCSACHKEQDYSVFFDFCPNCGADNRESEEEV